GEVKADEGSGNNGVHAGLGVGDVHTAQFANNAKNPGDQDTVKDCALDLFDQHDRNDQDADQGQNGTDTYAVEGFALEALVGQQGRITVDDELGVLQAHKGDKQTNAHADSRFEGCRDSVENGFPDVGQGQHDEDEAFGKNSHQSHLPGVAHFQHNRIGKVGIQAHAGSQRKGIVGQQCHQGRADKGRQRGGNQNGISVHSGGRKNAGV